MSIPGPQANPSSPSAIPGTPPAPVKLSADVHAAAATDAARPFPLADKVRVRLLDDADSLAQITGLLHRAYKQHADRGIHALAAFQPEEVTRKRIAGGECFVALYLGKIVGTILFKSPQQTIASGIGGTTPIAFFARGDVASFSQFAVEPDLQGRGIGSVLMSTVEARAKTVHARELGLSTPEPATWLIEMYHRHGYRVVERVQWSETNYVSAIMSKTIA